MASTHTQCRLLPVCSVTSHMMFWTHFRVWCFHQILWVEVHNTVAPRVTIVEGWSREEIKPKVARLLQLMLLGRCQSCREIDGGMLRLACDTLAHTSYHHHHHNHHYLKWLITFATGCWTQQARRGEGNRQACRYRNTNRQTEKDLKRQTDRQAEQNRITEWHV